MAQVQQQNTDWRRTLTFQERIGATAKIAKAYRAAHPGCSGPDASLHGKAAEESARRDAVSARDYESLISEAIHMLQSTAPPTSPMPPEDRQFTERPKYSLPYSTAVMGRYANASHLANGLHSEMYIAEAPLGLDLGRSIDATGPSIVALKLTTPARMQAPHDSAREARILKASASQHVIRLVDTFNQAGGRFVLVFPYMPFDLNVILRDHSLRGSNRRLILRDVFAGLAYIHDRGIIHRDIKPSNILLASIDGPAYLSDFGTAWSPLDDGSEPADEKISDVGTTSYRPPELLFGSRCYTIALDMWAAGCVVAQVTSLGYYRTLFDSGELGSELALIKSQFETLGTPNEGSWPEANALPDWGKMAFAVYPGKSWEEILPDCDHDARDLVSGLVIYESSSRLSAREALDHKYLSDVPYRANTPT